jgi:hypothetical protein
MYIWFFLILFGLIMWGFVVLYGQTLWLVGLLLFLLPTTWEIYSLFTRRGFKYQPLNLEAEPDIATLWLDESEAGPSPETITGEPRNGLLKRQVVAQALTYFVFGLLLILTFMISPSKSLPIISAYDIWNTVINIGEWLLIWALVPIGVAAILWAITLFFITFKWEVVEQLESRFQRVQRWNHILYWPALGIVFTSSFASIWARMAKEGASEPFLLIVYGLGIMVLLILLVHHVRSRHR